MILKTPKSNDDWVGEFLNKGLRGKAMVQCKVMMQRKINKIPDIDDMKPTQLTYIFEGQYTTRRRSKNGSVWTNDAEKAWASEIFETGGKQPGTHSATKLMI